MAVDTKTRNDILEVLNEVSASAEVDDDVIPVTDDNITIMKNVTLPGMEYDDAGNFTRYVKAKMSVFYTFVQTAWNAWFGTDATSGVQKQWADLSADAVAKTTAANTAAGRAETAAQNTETAITNANNAATNANEKATAANTAAGSANTAAGAANTAAANANDKAALANTAAGAANTAAQNANDKASLANTAAGNANTATTNANNAASAANTAAGRVDSAITAAEAATEGAENVNAQLSGMTVTITNREGTENSVNIGFEIYNTYPSVVAMNADAANVPTGKFVMIATTDPTSADNAKLYGKNSQGGFTFLSDLDQASSAAWADWLNNMKPQIEADHTQAVSDHTRAEGDHSTATTDHTTADADHTTAEGDHTQAVSDSSQAADDHIQAGEDHTASVNATNAATTQAGYAKTQGDYAKDKGDHTDQIRSDGYVYTYDPTNPQAGEDGYYKTDRHVVAEVDISTLTEEQIAAIIAGFAFATVAEAEAAAEELD